MLQNAYFLAKIGADTVESEQHLPKICQKLATTLRVRRVLRRGAEPELLDGPLDDAFVGAVRSGLMWRYADFSNRFLLKF